MRTEIPIVVLGPDGRPLAGAAATVRTRPGGATATVYSAETGTGTSPNPLTSDAQGRVNGWLERGAYDVTITAAGLTTYVEQIDSAPASDSALDALWLPDGVVSTAKIADRAVTNAKLADLAVTAAKIADGTITSAKIADGTITGADLADGTITSADIADGTIARGDLNFGPIVIGALTIRGGVGAMTSPATLINHGGTYAPFAVVVGYYAIGNQPAFAPINYDMPNGTQLTIYGQGAGSSFSWIGIWN
jgi:hypothetical protein